MGWWPRVPISNYSYSTEHRSAHPPILETHCLFLYNVASYIYLFPLITNIDRDNGKDKDKVNDKDNDKDKSSYIGDTLSFSYNVAPIYLFYLSLSLQTLTKTKTMIETKLFLTHRLFSFIKNIVFQILHVHLYNMYCFCGQIPLFGLFLIVWRSPFPILSKRFQELSIVSSS